MAKNPVPRVPVTKDARRRVFQKTGGHCHICGCALSDPWCVDHVVPHRGGGECSEDNFLPACPECNRARWCTEPDQFRQILRLGIFLHREVRAKTGLGKEVLAYCEKREEANHRRRTRQNNLTNMASADGAERGAEKPVNDAAANEIIRILETATSEPATPFRTLIRFNGHEVTIDFDPVKRKSLPMQFRSPGFQPRTSAIGVDELNYALQKFFGRLAEESTVVPRIARE